MPVKKPSRTNGGPKFIRLSPWRVVNTSQIASVVYDDDECRVRVFLVGVRDSVLLDVTRDRALAAYESLCATLGAV